MTYVRNKLNEPRALLRRAFYAAKAVGLASSDAEIGREWADAVADDWSEVEELLFSWNKERTQSRLSARLRSSR